MIFNNEFIEQIKESCKFKTVRNKVYSLGVHEIHSKDDAKSHGFIRIVSVAEMHWDSNRFLSQASCVKISYADCGFKSYNESIKFYMDYIIEEKCYLHEFVYLN